LTLGASFDPIVFEEMGVLGFAADVAQARRWYQQAAELGSSEAKRRLERLAKMVP
jgi:TPR repeat protein